MIRYLQGKVLDIRAKECTVLTPSGVGYRIFIAGELLSHLEKGKPIEIHTVMIVKENEMSLYGFYEETTQGLFEKLISVSGIGPKTALQMVSTPPSQFMRAIEEGDIGFLTKIPGLGKKTAERLIIELRGKIDLSAQTPSAPLSPATEEAVQALENLGYDKGSIEKKLKNAPEKASAEDLVKYFLSSDV